MSTKPIPAKPDLLSLQSEVERLRGELSALQQEQGRLREALEKIISAADLIDLESAIQESREALAASPLTPPMETCEWSQDDHGGDSTWETQCKHAFYFDGADGPDDAGFRVCPFCGKALTESRTSSVASPLTGGEKEPSDV